MTLVWLQCFPGVYTQLSHLNLRRAILALDLRLICDQGQSYIHID